MNYVFFSLIKAPYPSIFRFGQRARTALCIFLVAFRTVYLHSSFCFFLLSLPFSLSLLGALAQFPKESFDGLGLPCAAIVIGRFRFQFTNPPRARREQLAKDEEQKTSARESEGWRVTAFCASKPRGWSRFEIPPSLRACSGGFRCRAECELTILKKTKNKAIRAKGGSSII